MTLKPALLISACLVCRSGLADDVDILWYSYADDASDYKAKIATIAANASNYTFGSGNVWNLTLFGAGDAVPEFGDFDVLVIHSGEAFRTNPPGGELVTPDFSGILDNRAAIESARGTRTFISGSDADFHAVRGDTGNPGNPPPATDAAWDGALGYVVNAIDWAADGQGLNVVSFYDGEFPGAFWWLDDDSFLHDELIGYVFSFLKDNTPFVSPALATLPVNAGLTTQGLSNWRNSFHGGFLLTIPGYAATVLDDAQAPLLALSIVRDTGTDPGPLPGAVQVPAMPGAFALLTVLWLNLVGTRRFMKINSLFR